MPKAVYIHVPFCKTICSYCAFTKFYTNEEFINKYLISLKKEIEITYKKEKIKTLYIGGGTPSALNYNQLKTLLEITNIFNKEKNLEFTIECNIDSLTKEKLNLMKKYKVNRLSIGIETTNKKLLKLLNRELDKEKTKEIINYSKKIGITNINLDLIYALPDQKIKDLDKDIDFILSLQPTHISTYSLMIEQNTKLYINKYKEIDQELDYQMYNFIIEKLKKYNYNHYEISNFSKLNYESKHNNTYWENKKYYGFGPGASSYINNERINNTKSLNKYFSYEFIKDKEKLNIYDIIEYEIILGLRLKRGIDLKLFEKKYNKKLIDIYNYEELIKNNLLFLNNNYLAINKNKMYISNKVISELLERKI